MRGTVYTYLCVCVYTSIFIKIFMSLTQYPTQDFFLIPRTDKKSNNDQKKIFS